MNTGVKIRNEYANPVGDNITYRSDNYSDLHTIVSNSIRIVYDRLQKEYWKAGWIKEDISKEIIEKINLLYVLIVDWKEFWQDV